MTTATLQPLTDRQKAIYAWVLEQHRLTRLGVTIRDVQTHFKFGSPNGAAQHLRALARKGWLELHANRARSILPTLEALAHEDA
jgi:repressor LexA